MAISTMEHHGYFWTGHPPQGLDAVMGQPWDFVITVCDRAKESCPIFPGQPVLAHWGMPDPAEATGTETERQRAFDDTLLLISRRLDLFWLFRWRNWRSLPCSSRSTKSVASEPHQ